jgi:hypothetical protein
MSNLSIEENIAALLLLVQGLDTKFNGIEARVRALETRSPVSHVAPPSPQASVAGDISSEEDSSEEGIRIADMDMYGPTGLPKTPAAGKPKKNKGKKSNPNTNEKDYRRETIHHHSVMEAERKASSVMVYGVQEPYDHIRLKSVDPPAFLAFFEAVTVYERRTGTKLNLSTLISPSVIEQIVALNPQLYGDLKVYALSREELYQVLQSIFRPKSRIAFYTLLSNNVEFVYSAHSRPSPEYFASFHLAMLKYKSNFIKFYEILAFQNPNNVPLTEFKEWGLLRLFNSKIPFEYASRIAQLIERKKFESIYEYTRDFLIKVEEDKTRSEDARVLKEHFGGTAYEARKYDPTKKVAERSTDQRVHNIDVIVQESDYEDHEEEGWNEYEEFDHEISALQYPNSSKPAAGPSVSREPLVCITKILYGTCTKADCKYDHKAEPVRKQQIKFAELIKKQLDSTAPARGPTRFPQRASNVDEVPPEDEDF